MSFIIYRKKTKFFLEKYFFPKLNSIKINVKVPPKNKIAIINLSVIPWDYRFQRPQQIATELAKNNIPVFYVDNEFCITNDTKNPPFIVTETFPNLFSTKLSSTNNYFIYQNLASVNDTRIISKSIKNIINTFNITHPIIKVDHPFWTPIVKELKLPTLYDCLDNQDNFELNSKKIINEEKLLFKFASKAFVTSQYLFTKASRYKSKKDIILVSNGTNFEHFTKNTIVSIENDLSKFPHPIFGYFGAIDKWMDTEFIEKLAKNTTGSVILIGQDNSNYKFKAKNIHLLGEKKYFVLPQYLKQFDACLVPFKLNSLTKAVNPVKVFEYFSQGKPVISSKLPELKQYSNALYFYNSQTDISQLVHTIINESPTLIKKRLQIAQNNTWKSKAVTIISIIKSL